MRDVTRPLYRQCGVAVLRSAALPMRELPSRWPTVADRDGCRAWLQSIWVAESWLVDAIRLASPGLAGRVDAICTTDRVSAKQVRRATMSVMRYVLRAGGRHTPFGLFAGVTSVAVGATAKASWCTDHQMVAGVDTQWLADVVTRLEACPELLERLDVVFTNLAIRRGSRLEAPQGPNRASIRHTNAIDTIRKTAGSPIRFGSLVDHLSDIFAGIDAVKARGLLTSLVQQGFLITALRSALTVTDPLTRLVDRLNHSGAATVPTVAPLLRELDDIRDELSHHNQPHTTRAAQSSIRTALTDRMNTLSQAGRTPVAVDLRLDCAVQLPTQLLEEMELAASALIRLSRQPTGDAVWREYYTAFCELYGTGTVVPLSEVVHPDSGIGFPATYPGSTMPSPMSGPSERDHKLLELAWQAMADGCQEILLTDATIESLAVGDPTTERRLPPHVELAARIHATNIEALDRGEYTLAVTPARSAGTLTSRFTPILPEAGLDDLYEAVPVATDGALPVQLSFPPAYPHAENVCRVPAYLPYVVSLGEHRGFDENTIPLDDLAITATAAAAGLHLVSLSRQRQLEPQMFHALALEKQPPPLGRFLAHLSRGLSVAWHEFDWGPPAQHLPFLPRVRYRRAVLAPARWRLTSDDAPPVASPGEWQQALQRWRRRWRCPDVVELRDADRSLPLTLTEPAHAAILQAHLARHGSARFTETAAADDLGWIDGHAHDVVLPLVTTQTPAPSPLTRARPRVTNHSHGQLPGTPAAGWCTPSSTPIPNG